MKRQFLVVLLVEQMFKSIFTLNFTGKDSVITLESISPIENQVWDAEGEVFTPGSQTEQEIFDYLAQTAGSDKWRKGDIKIQTEAELVGLLEAITTNQSGLTSMSVHELKLDPETREQLQVEVINFVAEEA